MDALSPPRDAAAVSLPKLLVGLYDPDGRLVGMSELADPRLGFCSHFNGMAGLGVTARPLDKRPDVTAEDIERNRQRHIDSLRGGRQA